MRDCPVSVQRTARSANGIRVSYENITGVVASLTESELDVLSCNRLAKPRAWLTRTTLRGGHGAGMFSWSRRALLPCVAFVAEKLRQCENHGASRALVGAYSSISFCIARD